jgi:membrane-bound lytic murein transglycosylase B
VPILGPALNGGAFAGIYDSDGGLWDGDTVWDHAVGPFQFIPQTWRSWGADGNGDGRADPSQIDDAALAAGCYLCHAGDLSTVEGWRHAVLSYNHSDRYSDEVAKVADQ